MIPKKSQWLSIWFIIFSCFIIIGFNLNNNDDQNGILAEQNDIEPSLIQLTATPFQKTNQIFPVQLTFGTTVKEEIKLKIPDGLEYQPSTENQQAYNPVVKFDYATREVTIVPVIEDETNPSTSQMVVLNFKSVEANSYSLQALMTSQQQEIVSNSLQIIVEKEEQSSDESTIEKEDDPEEIVPPPADTKTADSDESSDLMNQFDLNLSARSVSNARSIETNKPEDRLIIKEKFRDPIGSGAKFIDPTILQMSDAKSQLGSIWSKNKLNLNKNFALKSYVYLGDSQASAADGITFTLQNDERMESNPNSVIGSGGMGLGAYSSASGKPYVHRGLSIEFDTYYNNGSSNRMDREVDKNGGRGHVAVVKPKTNNNNYTGEHSHIQYPTDYLSNGTWRSFIVTWDSKTNQLSYQLEGLDKVTFAINPQTEFGGDSVYWGFTSSTGSSYAQNAIAISELPQEIDATQEVTIKNNTSNTTATTEQEANAGDVIEYHIKNSYLSEEDWIADWTNVVSTGTLPEGVTYQQGSSTINGVPIADSALTINGSTISFPKTTFTKTQRHQEIVFRVQVNQDVKGPQDLTSTFKAKGDNYIAEGNPVIIHLLEQPTGEVVVQYLNENNQKIIEDIHLKGYSGDDYQAERKESPDYLLVGIPENEKGIFRDGEITNVIYKYKTRALEFISAPIKIDFGEDLTISSKTKTYPLTAMDGKLTVQDTRADKKSWTITAKMKKVLTSTENQVLPNAVQYTKQGQTSIINSAATVIFETTSPDDNAVDVSDNWIPNGDGLSLKIHPGEAYPEAYSGTINWTLQNTPANQ
ncbi:MULTISPECIES: lectin-like domain-containing protein [Carnobacterium]|uniref:lectin-like domain-containing protein n=1 Tax=Carnobacterium TaxID=2747 RepID=UPI00288E5160|nr:MULTISPECIES: MucBP domain-containing protein [Carnobacterium]MDT1939460.1 MucBP domain-containing protein [Carnobacterium divergens]MDT1941898.1 MucBP domain-containing protein [Carnobacterium divergens]MDT1947696.1 MucBP domain-containing protein [Carnobacterium divergens]MDT1950184.1 MucBP domain-containing protein [Carnobacterium divergens]MDT1955362.1 MucBP domain-containing protein [Carnobacterium divergens]